MQPKTIGEHLRKRRFSLGLRQKEAARRLGISQVTLSRWEYDKVYPTWPHQPALIAYLGYDPSTNPALGSPKGNETYGVAFLSSNPSTNLSHQITRYRLQVKKNRKQFAKELGICPKTIWGWETGRRKPSASLRARIVALLDQETASLK